MKLSRGSTARVAKPNLFQVAEIARPLFGNAENCPPPPPTFSPLPRVHACGVMGRSGAEKPKDVSKSGVGKDKGMATKEGRVAKGTKGSSPPLKSKKSTKPNEKHKGTTASKGTEPRPGIYHMKKALKKKLALVDKYKELKEKGQLEDFMSKRRKKMMLRDHTLFPRARND